MAAELGSTGSTARTAEQEFLEQLADYRMTITKALAKPNPKEHSEAAAHPVRLPQSSLHQDDAPPGLGKGEAKTDCEENMKTMQQQQHQSVTVKDEQEREKAAEDRGMETEDVEQDAQEEWYHEYGDEDDLSSEGDPDDMISFSCPFGGGTRLVPYKPSFTS